MKYKLSFLFTLSCVLIPFISLHPQPISKDSLYLGQTLPGNTAKLFTAGILALPGYFVSERIAISPDGKEIYYTERNGYSAGSKARIKYFKYIDNKWNGPFNLFDYYSNLSSLSAKDYITSPGLSPDGNILFFHDSKHQSYYSVKKDIGWSEPLIFWNNPLFKHYLQLSNSGNYYLISSLKAGTSDLGLCKIHISNTDTIFQFLKFPLNSEKDVIDFYISRDESFIIFSSMPKSYRACYGYVDLFITYRKKDSSWTNPRNLGPLVNAVSLANWGPYVTHDNKYLFLSRGISDSTTNLYWVALGNLIDSLKYTNFVPYVKNSIPNQTAVKELLFNYSIPDSIFIDDNGNNTLTYTAALSNGKPLPDWLSFNPATQTFSGVPNKIEVDSIKVTATDTAGASAYSIFAISAAVPTIDYFGQTPPGDSAAIFAPGIISRADRLEGKICFSPDCSEFYFTVWGIKFSSCKIYYTKRVNNTWTEQVEAPFSKGHYCGEPSFSADGNKLFFEYSSKDTPTNIWMVQHTPEGWSDPQELHSPINSTRWDAGYSELSDSIAYFASDRPGGLDDKGDIWRVYRVPGQPLQAENLGASVNSTAWDACPCIAHDGSYLIFTSERPGGHGYSDLYIIFKKQDDRWTDPVNMERNGSGININNKSSGEVDPSLSPDGRFLFFSRHTNTEGIETQDIYWISTKVIENIKKEVFNPKLIK